MSQPSLLSLQAGQPQMTNERGVPDATHGVYATAFRKQPVAGKAFLGRTNLEGDRQADLVHHGGQDKAVNAYAFEHYAHWMSVLGLTEMPCGAFGENFTLSGLVETDVCIGDVYSVGEARVRVSQPRIPCFKLARRWQREDLAALVQASGFTGWYFSVVAEGSVQAGDALELLERPCPEWTIARANEVMHDRIDDVDSAAALAACPALAEAWRSVLAKRAGRVS